MALLASIKKLQNAGIHFYSELAGLFGSNRMISETWKCMSQDLMQQVASLDSLPQSFWHQIREEEAALREAVQACPIPETGEEGRTLQYFLARSLDFEEPLILKVYVPLIRRLRTHWSGQVLDLYIMAKAHVSRLLQVVRSFSGDPASIQRVTSLVESFEKEVQLPEEPVRVSAAERSRKPAKLPAQPRAGSRRSLPIENRPIPKQRKTLIKVPRRAQR